MEFRRGLFGFIFVVWGIQACLVASQGLSRGSFPKGFVFGTASSAYQVCLFIYFYFLLLLLFFGCWFHHYLLIFQIKVLLEIGSKIDGHFLKLSWVIDPFNADWIFWHSIDGFVSILLWFCLQYEGAVKEDGRGPTVWDTFAHTFGNFDKNFWFLWMLKKVNLWIRSKAKLPLQARWLILVMLMLLLISTTDLRFE